MDQSSESSLNLSWQFIRANLNGMGGAADSIYGAGLRSMMQLSPKPSAESEPIDGFVLAFAKHSQQQQQSGGQAAGANNATAAAKSVTSGHVAGNASAIYLGPRISAQAPAGHPHGHAFGTAYRSQAADASELQWQAIQLGAQSRQHLLKNLECGTQYALKIWAYNKVGKGEPSELLWTSTRGKGEWSRANTAYLIKART